MWEEKARARTSPDGTTHLLWTTCLHLSHCLRPSVFPTAPLYARGLSNLGNTCFLNSILQAIASCPSFLSYTEAMTSVVAAGSCVFTEKLHKCLRGKTLVSVYRIAYRIGKTNGCAPMPLAVRLSDIRSKSSFGTVNPKALLNMLIKFNPEIGGFEQQVHNRHTYIHTTTDIQNPLCDCVSCVLDAALTSHTHPCFHVSMCLCFHVPCSMFPVPMFLCAGRSGDSGEHAVPGEGGGGRDMQGGRAASTPQAGQRNALTRAFGTAAARRSHG
jgi:hypothetical protein